MGTAARGGLEGLRFPWGNTISHCQANYASRWTAGHPVYDLNTAEGFHPAFEDGVTPYTSPAGYFQPNGYGLYDMVGNVWEWCWDWYWYYPGGSQSDPHGALTGSAKVIRGGSWPSSASDCRVSYRYYGMRDMQYFGIGFRSVLYVSQR